MGKVYLVGAGPGDPQLITLKGIELLKTCDVVIYDRLASFQLLDYVRADCLKIYVGKRAGYHSKKQDEINTIIIENALKYEKVLRLKGGDSFVFGRGGEEIQELIKNGIAYEVIPGVTSAIAVPECAGIPVTHRGVSQSFHVICGHTSGSENQLTDNYEALAKLDGTLVFLMGLSNIQKIVDTLISYGKDKLTPAAVISDGTMNNQRMVRGNICDIVGKVKEDAIESPAIIVIGETAKLEFYSKSKLPLSGIKIGITGTKVMCDKLEKGLSENGAKVYTVCNMQVIETLHIKEFEMQLHEISNYQWVIFTSQNAIQIFFEKMAQLQIDRRNLNKIKFAVIGSGTKDALKKFGYYADFLPSKFTATALADDFSKVINQNEKVLIPRALRGSEELIEIFARNHVNFKETVIYDVKGSLTENSEYIPEMNCLIFASQSGVEDFFDQIENNNIKLAKNVKIACIGEITEKAIKKSKNNADIIASVFNAEGLVDAISKADWELYR